MSRVLAYANKYYDVPRNSVDFIAQETMRIVENSELQHDSDPHRAIAAIRAMQAMTRISPEFDEFITATLADIDDEKNLIATRNAIWSYMPAGARPIEPVRFANDAIIATCKAAPKPKLIMVDNDLYLTTYDFVQYLWGRIGAIIADEFGVGVILRPDAILIAEDYKAVVGECDFEIVDVRHGLCVDDPTYSIYVEMQFKSVMLRDIMVGLGLEPINTIIIGKLLR